MDTTEKQKRTITLTDRPPVRITEDDWEIIAVAKWWDNQYEFQANRKAQIRVREHADGRRIVYGFSSSQFQNDSGASAGFMTDAAGTVDAIHKVAEIIGHESLAAECIADLPAEEID